MSIHRSLKIKSALLRSRNVWTRISRLDHPLSKKAKDVASAAVALTAIAAGVVWLVVLIG